MKILPAPAVALFSFILYVKTLAPTVLMADGGEFQFVPYLGGIAHPTGYPLYVISGWLWSHLWPFGDVAYRMNLFSALWAAVAVGLFYLAAEEMMRPLVSEPLAHLGAAVGALSLAFSETFWSQAIIAEVYSLNSFFVAGIFYLLLSGKFSLAFLAFFYGLSLTHHRSIVLFLPGLFVFLLLEGKLAGKGLSFWLKILFSFLAPLALYLYIPWRAPNTPYLYLSLKENEKLILYHNTLKGFLNHISGQPFAGALSLPDFARLEQVALLFKGQFGWFGLFLGMVGLVRLISARKWSCLALTGLAWLAIVAFNLCYAIGDFYVLFTPAYFVLALWLGLGVASLAEWVGRGIARWKGSPVRYGLWEKGYQKVVAGIEGLVSKMVGFLFFILPFSLLVINYGQLDRSRDFSARDFWREILEASPPQGAILVSNDRDEIMPFWYMQYVEGLRADLLGLFPLIVPEYKNLGELVDSLLEDKARPIYLIKDMPGLEIKYRLRRAGPLVEVLSPAVVKEPDYPLGINLGESVRLLGYDLWPQIPQPGGELRVALYWQGMREVRGNFSSFVHLFDGEGQKWASSDHLPGGDYYPSSFWRPGEVLRDEHCLNLPADIPPGHYHLLGGMYLLPSLKPFWEKIFLGEIIIKKVPGSSFKPGT